MQNQDPWAEFPSETESSIAFYTINEDALAHVDGQTDNPCLWLEDYGEVRVYKRDVDGLKAAKQGLELFASGSEIPLDKDISQRSSLMLDRHYELYSRGFKIDLANFGDQETLEVRIPLFMENEYRSLLGVEHWTSQPGWLTAARVTTEQDDRTGEKPNYYQMTFKLAAPG